MRRFCALALLAAVVLSSSAAADPCECFPQCRCRKGPVLNFGVDTNQLGKLPAVPTVEARTVKMPPEWEGFPEELRNIAFWGAVLGSSLCVIGAALLVVTAAKSGKT